MNRDEKVNRMLSLMRDAWRVEGDGVDAERRAFEAVASHFPEPVGVDESRVNLGGIDAIRTQPKNGVDAAAPVVLYLHGGAFLIGSAGIYREQSARLTVAAGASVYTLDYRLAPEHPFPAAPDDTLTAFRALVDSGVKASKIVIAGDSAGANLALGAAMRLRDARAAKPAGLVLISPWIDLTCSSASMETNANARHLAQRPGLLASASSYLGSTDARTPLASPLYGNLAGLPPMLVQVGSLETLLDESIELKRKATAAGAQSELQVFDGMVHEWHLMSALLPVYAPLEEAGEAIDAAGRFVRNVTSG